MGATAQALGAATHETFTYDAEGNLLTPNFYDYHVPARARHAAAQDRAIESPSPFTPLGTKGHGRGRRRGIHASAPRSRTRCARRRRIVTTRNPYHRVWECSHPERTRGAGGRGEP
jgi:2-furoyl-CoA dehydrogenase large subunit